MPKQLLHEKPRSLHKRMQSILETIFRPELASCRLCSTPTRNGTYPVAELSFGMYNICVHHVVLSYAYWGKKERKKKERKKEREKEKEKEDEEIEIFMLGFLDSVKGEWN